MPRRYKQTKHPSPETLATLHPADHPRARAVHDCGGVLIGVPLNRDRFAADLAKYAPGCGSPTHVAATNGGTMRCGAKLSLFGGPATPQFCAACQDQGLTNGPLVSGGNYH